MHFRSPRTPAERMAMRPVEGVEPYLELGFDELADELVARRVIPSRDLIDLSGLDPAWQPAVLRGVLVMHDLFPRALWLPGGIGVDWDQNRKRFTGIGALFWAEDRRITVNATTFSKSEARRAGRRGYLEAVQDALVSMVVHECWHCLQMAYTADVVEQMRDAWVDVTGDPRATYPLADPAWRELISEEIGPYAVTRLVELQAELVRAYLQGMREGESAALAVSLLAVADRFFGPDGTERPLVERQEKELPFDISVTPIRESLWIECEEGVLGDRNPDLLSLGCNSVQYIETEDGHLFRIADGIIIDATLAASQLAGGGALDEVAYRIPEHLLTWHKHQYDAGAMFPLPCLRASVGEPMFLYDPWIPAGELRADLAQVTVPIAPAPITQVIEVPILANARGSTVPDLRPERSDLVRRVEQLLAPLGQGFEPCRVNEIPSSLGDPFGEFATPERVRWLRLTDAKLTEADVATRPYRCGVVVFDEAGQSREFQRFADFFNYHRAIPDIVVGEPLSDEATGGKLWSLGPIAEVYVVECLPVAHRHLRPFERWSGTSDAVDRPAAGTDPAATALGS